MEQQRSEQDSFVGDALALALCMFLLGFADLFCLIFTSISSDEALPICSVLCNLFPRLCWYVEVFDGGFEGVFVSLLLTSMGAFTHF